MVAFIDEDCIEKYDVFDGNGEMCERYFYHFKMIKRFEDLNSLTLNDGTSNQFFNFTTIFLNYFNFKINL